MRAWGFMLGGLIIWAVHLLGVYGVASLADVVARADAPASRLGVGALTLACGAGDIVLLVTAWRRARVAAGDLAPFAASLAGLGAGLSLIAVIWQGLPAILGH